MSPIEKKIATRLVEEALGRGHNITVNDGGAYVVKRSSNKDEIIASLGSSDADVLIVRDASANRIGAIALIWGNGEDLISDHTDNAEINEIVAIANGEGV